MFIIKLTFVINLKLLVIKQSLKAYENVEEKKYDIIGLVMLVLRLKTTEGDDGNALHKTLFMISLQIHISEKQSIAKTVLFIQLFSVNTFENMLKKKHLKIWNLKRSSSMIL